MSAQLALLGLLGGSVSTAPKEIPTDGERMNVPQEKWRPVQDYEGLYEVSNLGRVRSLDRDSVDRRGVARFIRGRLMRHATVRGGYKTVCLYRNGRQTNRKVHRMVLQAFVGEPPPEHQGGHLNGDPGDNRLENLAWVTPRQNSAHRKVHGTEARGERHGLARLTEDDVRAIRRLYRSPEWSQSKLARKYGVVLATIGYIVRRETWNHVEDR